MGTLDHIRADYHVSMHHSLFAQRARAGTAVTKSVGGTTFPVVTCADSYNDTSVVLSYGVAQRLSIPMTLNASQGSTLGNLFEGATRAFVRDSLALFGHL